MASVMDTIGNPKYQELSPEARAIVLQKKYPAFSTLKPEAQQLVLNAGEPKQEPPEESSMFMTMLTNVPSDAWQVAKDTMYPLTNFSEFKEGMSALATDPQAREQVWGEMKKRYGGMSELGQYMEESPVQFATDFLGALSGVGMLGKVSKVAAAAGKVGKAADPMRLAGTARKALAATKLPEKLFESSMKIPPGSVSAPVRESIIDTLVRKEGLKLKPKTIEKMNKMVSQLDNDISAELDRLSPPPVFGGTMAPGAGSTIDVADITSALDNLKLRKDVTGRPRSKEYRKAIDRTKDLYIEHAYAAGGEISLSNAHALKKGTYQEIQEFYKKGQKPESGRAGLRNNAENMAKAEAAKTIRTAILEHPDVPASVKRDLAREAGLVNARKWVERATSRRANLDVVSLSGMAFGVLVEKGIPGALAWQIIRAQQANIAIGIAQGSRKLQALGAAYKGSIARVIPGVVGLHRKRKDHW